MSISEKSYNKYWKRIYDQIISLLNQKKDLKIIWKDVTLKELNYSNIVGKKCIYKYGKPSEQISSVQDIMDGYSFSREPVINILNNDNIDGFIECGSGWGRNIYFMIMNNLVPKNIDYYGLELTKPGTDSFNLLKELAPDYYLYGYQFDINKSDIILEKQYNKLLISTFWAIEQVPEVSIDFFYKVLSLSKQVIGVHIEPIGWQLSREQKEKYHSDDRNLCIHKPNYNTNLFSLLTLLEKRNLIKILKVEVDFFNFVKTNSCGTLIIWEKIN